MVVSTAEPTVRVLPLKLVSGQLTEDAVWTKEFVWRINGTFRVPAVGIDLVIEPGTRVEFVFGTIQIAKGANIEAVGTASSPITFVRLGRASGVDSKIDFLRDSVGTLDHVLLDGVELVIDSKNVEVSNFEMKNTNRAVYLTHAAMFHHNFVHDNTIGIYLNIRADLLLSYNNISDNYTGMNIQIADSTKLRHNSILDNNININVTALDAYSIVASDNWWGTTDRDEIEDSIFHWKDDLTLTEVTYDTVRGEPSPETP